MADVFGVKDYQRPEYLPRRISDNLYKMHKNKSKRESDNGIVRTARQIILRIGLEAVGIITSLVSIFSTKELVQMADQDDLIDNNNHIIQSIQEHETRIARQEQMTKQMKKHLEGVERELIMTKNADNIILHMIALKSYATTSQDIYKDFKKGYTHY